MAAKTWSDQQGKRFPIVNYMMPYLDMDDRVVPGLMVAALCQLYASQMQFLGRPHKRGCTLV